MGAVHAFNRRVPVWVPWRAGQLRTCLPEGSRPAGFSCLAGCPMCFFFFMFDRVLRVRGRLCVRHHGCGSVRSVLEVVVSVFDSSFPTFPWRGGTNCRLGTRSPHLAWFLSKMIACLILLTISQGRL